MLAHLTSEPESSLLRTPAASEGERGHQSPDKARARGGQVTLTGQVVNELMPTPVASDGKHGDYPGDWARKSPAIGTIVHGTDFGKYAPAIRRWETVTGNPAPSPTEDGKLSAKFTEWMMGLPAGHITDTPGLNRVKQLKACGNGVVPQQATLAIERLTNGL